MFYYVIEQIVFFIVVFNAKNGYNTVYSCLNGFKYMIHLKY